MPTRRPVKAVSYRLPESTIGQVKALCLDLDQDATTVLIVAINELWKREIGDGDPRTTLDELAERVARLETTSRLSAAEEK